ncbi:helix-turn-helix domain-containing protein [Clostridium sp. C8-1-8]|uniref:PucR family transcriptional regulator n=1 Tax=Clostridium sp. C8-1-8 TaxID=2698831 RepID=UPI001FAC4A3F|nr:helix-turn-helix domain-containing protein [Clostridium sp. C8-1-8]
MIILKDLFIHLENTCGSKIYGSFNPEDNIENIDFFDMRKEALANTLYLAYYTTYQNELTLENNRKLLILSKDILENAQNSTLYLLTEKSIEEIYKLSMEFLLNQYSLYEKKYTINNSLHHCDNINKILNVSEQYINNPIFLLDTSYRILGQSNLAASSKDSSLDKQDGKCYLVLDTVKTMKRDKCIDDIYNLDKAFFHLADKNLIFCGVRINNITVGYICVLQELRPFVEMDLEIINELSKTLSIFIEKSDQFISSSGLEEEYYVIDMLITNSYSINYLEERLNAVNFKLKANFLIITVPFYKKYADYRHNFGLNQLIQNCKLILGNCIAAYYDSKIIFLLSSSSDTVISLEQKTRFKDLLRLNKLKAGISIVFNNIHHIKDFYNQSNYCLTLSDRLNSSDNMLYFEDYIEYYLFYNLEEYKKEAITLKTLIHPFITKLIEHDAKTNSELLNTLECYLESDRNSALSSKKLNVHPSTFFYRLHKIENLLSCTFSDSKLLFKLELSLKINKYINSLR